MERRVFRWVLILLGLLALTIAVAVISMALGPSNIGPDKVVLILLSKVPVLGDHIAKTWSQGDENIVLVIRMPRVLLGLLVGASLGLAGVTSQGVFKNPMADPYILGISSGAAMGASLVILIGVGVEHVFLRHRRRGLCRSAPRGFSRLQHRPGRTISSRSRRCCCRASRCRRSSRRSPTS